jgi:hypothetical protein
MLSVNDIYLQLEANQKIREKKIISPCIEIIDEELKKINVFPCEIRCFLKSEENGHYYARLFQFELEQIKKNYCLAGWNVQILIWRDGEWRRKYFFQSSNVPHEFKLIFNLPSFSLILWRKFKTYFFSIFKKEKFLLPKKSIYRD